MDTRDSSFPNNEHTAGGNIFLQTQIRNFQKNCWLWGLINRLLYPIAQVARRSAEMFKPGHRVACTTLRAQCCSSLRIQKMNAGVA